MFADQDLRNRSFQRQQLIGANFVGARFGRTRRQLQIWVGAAIAALLVSVHTISTLVASSLGQTPADLAWRYGVALGVS